MLVEIVMRAAGKSFGLVLLGATACPAAADPIADFYRGKTITINVGAGIGSGADVATRMVARNLGKHIPGHPTVLAKNMVGSGGIQLYNYIYGIGAKDGTEFGSLVQFPFEHLFGVAGPRATFDAVRFRWLGGSVRFAAVAIAWNASTPVRKAEDLLTQELLVGASTALSNSATDAFLVRNVLGFKYRVVTGYQGGADIDLAMVRGETHGRAQATWPAIKQRNPEWLTDGKISILYQMGLDKSPEVPAHVPLILDFAKTPEDRQVLELKFATYAIGYPFFGPPEIPADRLAAVRAGLAATLNDPDTRADAARLRLDLDPMSGEAVEGIIRKAHASPPAVVARLLAASKAP